MILDLDMTISSMIFSASGWRGVFCETGDEEGKGKNISNAHKFIAAMGAKVFSDYLSLIRPGKGAVIVGRDTRPTGEAISDAVIRMLLSEGREIRYLGVCAAPEIMAFAESGGLTRNISGRIPEMGFIYISASHNPIGHNGLKFGLNDGGVIQGFQNAILVSSFNELCKDKNYSDKIMSLVESVPKKSLIKVYEKEKEFKNIALLNYFYFTIGVVSGTDMINESRNFYSKLETKMKYRPLGIAADFNGSARTLSIDRDFFHSLGIAFHTINDKPGIIVHRIVPEGESLEPCREFLEKLHKDDPSVILGYVPDCDGDRGNIVYWDDRYKKAMILEAQEVFALACLCEFAFLHQKGDLNKGKAAIAVNDPTSLRIDRIAKCFGIKVFRAEVGEANVVGLARNLRKEGYLVRILGEGSAGGVIIHPSSVRDPLNTLGAIIKILSIRSVGMEKGLFEIWCDVSNQKDLYREDFTLSDIMASFFKYNSTGAYSDLALLKIKTEDHSLLKERYQNIFLREWEEKKKYLYDNYSIIRWEVIAYNGLNETRGINNFGKAGRGGLKIEFFRATEPDFPSSYIWMRGSGTEPVFRVMADSEYIKEYEFMIDWHRKMVMEADQTGAEYGN